MRFATHHAAPVMVEVDRITMKWAENWNRFGLGRRIFLTLLDSERAHQAANIARYGAVVMPAKKVRKVGPLERRYG